MLKNLSKILCLQSLWISVALGAKETEETSFFSSLGIFGEIVSWASALGLFIVFVLLASIIGKITAKKVQSRANYDTHQEVVILFERCVYFAIIILGGIVSFSLVNVDLTWILGPLTFGLGFALKDQVSNIIAGIVILTQHKFKINDIIKINDQVGVIKNIEIRSTELQDFDGTKYTIPNSDMLNSVVQNFTNNSFRRISIPVSVHYKTDLTLAIQTSLQAIKKHKQVALEPAPDVLISKFGESAIELEVRIWFEVGSNWFVIQSEIIQMLKEAFDKANIVIPFPMRTIHLDPQNKGVLNALASKS